MTIQQFMEENKIAILVEANIETKCFDIVKGKAELQSQDLFEQLILVSPAYTLTVIYPFKIADKLFRQIKFCRLVIYLIETIDI